MAEPASRVLRIGRLYFNGVNACAVVGVQPDGSGKPFTVYGWNGITIAEWVYLCWPKPSTAWDRLSMIGDRWVDYPCTYLCTNNLNEWTYLIVVFGVRRPDGTHYEYSCRFFDIQNTWVHVVRMFTLDSREFSVWLNGVKVYSVNVPSTNLTILEWNPDNATNPKRYKQFILGADTGIYTYMRSIYGEVRIYNRALSADEIYEIYSKGTVIKDGLVLCLPFHEGEGNIAHDVSGYDNHGTIYGGAMWTVKKALRVLPKAR